MTDSTTLVDRGRYWLEVEDANAPSSLEASITFDLIRDLTERVEQLQAWRVEGIAVLTHWEKVWEAAGSPGPLGHSKAQNVLDHVERLHAVLWSMAANRAPRHPDDTHVEVFMPVDVWAEFRP